MEQSLSSLETKIDDLLESTEGQADVAARMLSGNQRVVGDDTTS